MCATIRHAKSLIYLQNTHCPLSVCIIFMLSSLTVKDVPDHTLPPFHPIGAHSALLKKGLSRLRTDLLI